MNPPKTNSEYKVWASSITDSLAKELADWIGYKEKNGGWTFIELKGQLDMKLDFASLLRARDELTEYKSGEAPRIEREHKLRAENDVLKAELEATKQRELALAGLIPKNQALKDELASLKTVAKVASTSPCRHSSAYTSFSCPTCQALESHSAKGYKLE